MKIRIEGCTAEELAAESPYLSLGKEYKTWPSCEAYLHEIEDDEGDFILVSARPNHQSAFLPQGARWVEVSE